MDDAELCEHVVGALAAIDSVLAVALGGSRATGTHRPDSDWDFGVYYRGRLDTGAIRAVGWEGQVFEPGEWGGGVFNGGAWLDIDGRRVDLIYRDLDDVERRWAEARAGTFAIERLPFHLAGIPTYVVVGELALGRVVHGRLPRPRYPAALSRGAAGRWHGEAAYSFDFGRRAYAERGEVAGAVGSLAKALMEEGHSRLAARREWVLNEKRLIERAGLAPAAALLGRVGTSPAALRRAYDRLEEVILGPGG
ncbi:MAG TPA: nucleotidyltransferase domain-containing protein [Acidimicrobiales bacterium]|nr:nucleotidyltransferase domain-containing protein [Acidimicrobiales bacterium]